VIPAVVADSRLFWLAIIDGLAAVYILPTVIAIARQVEGLGLVICLNTIPVGTSMTGSLLTDGRDQQTRERAACGAVAIVRSKI
jgi:hypothetical protein